MDIDPSHSETLRQKSDALRALSTGPISSSISNLSVSSRVLPSEKDFHFYYNFDEFRIPIDEIGAKSHSILQQIGSSNPFWGQREMQLPNDVEEDGYDWLVNVNDEVAERFDASVDEFSRLRKAEEEGARGRGRGSVDEDGFRLVCGRRKKVSEESSGSQLTTTSVRVAERDKKTAGPKPKVPFHIPTIKRPQEEFNMKVNNANEPFQHVWIERSEDGSRFIHPLEKLSVSDFVDGNVENLEPMKPPPLEATPFKLVEEVKDLKELAAKLRSVNEFAVDLEHNQYRSFQGLTCLMQISTRTEDFVVDTLKLRIHVGPYLRDVFKDPTKKKVMHGADRDIAWLQRDFGIYVCNLFDTGQASRVLQMERNSLEYLLQHFCEVTANKEYQNADWRLRPLPLEMIRYAREDTHYLLYIYDLMRIRLRSESKDLENSDAPNPDALLLEVYKRSYDICIQLYEKELLTDTSYLYIYGVQKTPLNAQQLSVVAGLCGWRDMLAREADESTGYILPNKTLLEIAKEMPLTTSKLRRFVKSKHPYVERNLSSVVSIIRHSVQNCKAFEAVAEQLKEGRIQMTPELNDAAADFPELHSAGDYSREASDVSYLGHVATDREGVSFAGISQNGNMRNDVDGGTASESLRKSDSFVSQKDPINGNVGHSAKVAEATVQVLKKPNRGFGALLGSSASKKKMDIMKDNGENKLEQIKSSVSLPFYPFVPREQQQLKQSPKQEDMSKIAGTPVSRDCSAAPELSTTVSEDIMLLESHHQVNEPPEEEPAAENKLEDVICLDSDSGEEPDDSSAVHENHENPNDPPETTAPELVVLDDDEGGDDEPMSLSDLSSSFKKCLESTSQSHANKEGSSDAKGLAQFKPFDYEAARREVKFGEDAEREMRTGDRIGGKNFGKKKSGGADRNKQDDGVLPQGKRRQAFPASGNRSSTFR